MKTQASSTKHQAPSTKHQLCSKLAALIYEDEATIRDGLINLNLPGAVAHLIDGETLKERALVVPTTEHIFIIFRGTQTKKQWLKNACFKYAEVFYRKWPQPILMHGGFKAGHDDVATEICSLLNMFRLSHDRRIVICGHSRGAAEAIIETLYCAGESFDMVDEVHLFGCPRTLAPTSAALFDTCCKTKTWRWVANNDAVTRVPFRWMGFKHVGQEMYFDSKDKFYRAPSLWRKVKGQVLGRAKGGLCDGLSDHNAAKEYQRLVGSFVFPSTKH